MKYVRTEGEGCPPQSIRKRMGRGWSVPEVYVRLGEMVCTHVRMLHLHKNVAVTQKTTNEEKIVSLDQPSVTRS